MNNEKKRQTANSRRLKIGAYGIAVTTLVIALVVFVNLIVSSLPVTVTHINTQEIDYSEVGEESQKVLNTLDGDVTLYFVVEKGKEDKRIEEILAHYKALSDKITIKNIDPVTNPTFIAKHTDEEVKSNSIIVVSDRRSRVIHYSDMYSVHFYGPDGTEISEDYYYMYLQYGYEAYYDEMIEAEMAITSALEYVSRETLPTLYTLTGHGETTLDDYYSAFLEVDNIAVSELDLASKEEVPEDSEAVLIINPTKDLNDDEFEDLSAYLDDGGDVVFITDYKFSSETLPNFASLAAKAGLEAEEGVIMQEDYYAFYPKIISSENGITSFIDSENATAVASVAHGINTVSGTNATVTPLLISDKNAEVHTVNESGNTEKKDSYISGIKEIPVGVCSDTSVSSDKRDGTSSFVWYSTTAIVDISVAYQYGTGNLELFLATVSHLCEKSTSVSIIGKSLGVEPIILTESQSNFWTITMTVVVPLVIVGAGFYVWFRRRRK